MAGSENEQSWVAGIHLSQEGKGVRQEAERRMVVSTRSAARTALCSARSYGPTPGSYGSHPIDPEHSELTDQ